MKINLIIFLLIIACKIDRKIITVQQNDSILKEKKTHIDLNLIAKILDFNLPAGSLDLKKNSFPDKFGIPIKIDDKGTYINTEPDSKTKNLFSIKKKWQTLLDKDGIKYQLEEEYSLIFSKYSSFGKKLKPSNYSFIGKKEEVNFYLLIGKHKSNNSLKSFNFINILTVDKKGNIIDHLPIYIDEKDYISSNSILSFINKNTKIHSKYFSSIEGEYSYNGKKDYEIDKEGKIIEL